MFKFAASLHIFDDTKDSISKEISLRASRLPKESQEMVLGIIEIVEKLNRKGRK